MIPDVKIMSEQKFRDCCLPANIKNTFYISIIDPDQEPLIEDSDNFMTLKVWDVPYTIGSYEAFTYKDAQKVYRFIKQNEGKDLICHCGIGVSRSAAIAEFYHEMMGGSYKQLLEKYPNILPTLTPILLYLRVAEKNNGEDIELKF